jgi:hypothetical protein
MGLPIINNGFTHETLNMSFYINLVHNVNRHKMSELK